MLDTGLLLSGVAVVLAMWLAARWLPVRSTPSDAIDSLIGPGIVGILAGRAVALVLDDPTSLRSLRTFLVVRGGVELWPGAAAAVLVLVASARRRGEGALTMLATFAPVALIGYATYEATCIVRDGCYGPKTAIGLRPDGLTTPMLPLGIIVGGGLVAIAIALARRANRPAAESLAFAVLAVATSRSAASFWLPRLGDGLTRAHRTSIAVAIVVAAVLVVTQVAHRSRVAT